MEQPNNITNKNTFYDHFQEILGQNSLMQHLTASLASSLQTSLMLLPQSKLTQISLTPEMKEVSEKISKMIDRIKDSIENEFCTINQVNHQLYKIADGLRKVIDLGKNQEQKSSFVLSQLNKQLKCKEAEIKDCQSAFKKQAKKKGEEGWKQQQYLCRKKQINLTPDQLYIQILKQCAKKIEAQIRFQYKESDRLQNKVNKTMVQFKTNLIDIWSQMFEKDISIRSTKKIVHDSNPEDRYSELENEYVKKQKSIDLFDFSKLQHIKKRLRLLEQADVSEFQQYQTYSISGSKIQVIEQSEIARILPF